MASNGSVDLQWLDGAAPSTTLVGSAFGVPWTQGAIDKTTALAATASNGSGIPLQSWPLAYWPDGSLKWTGHALAVTEGLTNKFTVAPGTPAEPTDEVTVTDANGQIRVTTGSFTAVFNKSGSTLIDSLQLDGSTKAAGGKLLINVQNAPDEPELGTSPKTALTDGQIEDVTIEQDGPVRAVIKVAGKYSGGGHAPFLPFTVRFYVSAGATALRIVHFFVFDGDQFSDFISGIGLTFTTPLTDELYNRQVRFASADGGLWAESVRGLSGLRRDATAPVLTPQFNGQAVPDISTWPTTVSSEVNLLPIWSDFTLDQLSAGRFGIVKRTNAGRKASFLDAGFGTRAAGAGYVGGATGGGVSFGLREFWQKAPSGLDVRNAGTDTANITVWAYSPRAPAMDMRHYDVVAHGLDLTYEDVGDPDPNPSGVGRSYEVILQAERATPARTDTVAFASSILTVPQVVATPSFYQSRSLFGGLWAQPTDKAPTIEKAKSDLLDFYVAEVDQRQFYGFWNYGDIMHTYDQTRHVWRYDVGGFAWDNAECGSDLWIWTSFLRTGRADVFRIAAAMTRHVSEVDFHHTGPFAGLGSRHHVTHWGDGAKEARMSSSTLKRPYFYLTADELVGDIMEYSLQADQAMYKWEPLRKVSPLPPQAPSRVRLGPDWTALAGNWFTQWERTMDDRWLERLKGGMADIAGFQYGFFTGGDGGAVGFFPDTGHMIDEGGEGTASYHLSMIFGGAELLIELIQIIDVPNFTKTFIEFCQYYNASNEVQTQRYGKGLNSAKNFPQWYAKYQAWAGVQLNDDSLKQAAWDVLNANTVGVWPPVTQVGGTDVLNPINEIANVATNDSAQLSLSQYGTLAMAPDQAPTSLWHMSPSVAGRAEPDESDEQTICGSLSEKESTVLEGNKTVADREGRRWWRRALCM
ncbi:hypothetical protein K488DRAFT_79570 [Vararia minispora EC-137]|uniref:Uncharacterized protein n=1 Tax=Vararia minispora EC-137 TaxID=1314806 RepID=A0ACB8QFE8_9AGAM|nr:hypothetical protein K488DRAFT_79570 [Vararia minispora EC-137]